MKEKGKLIVIEGTDGSGKATQSKLLYEKLLQEGKKVKLISFPDYESDTSALVKMYLKGEFGQKPEDVNLYAASSFYAVDRVGSYLKNWKSFYNEGYVIICDRYTTSNMVHQAAKLDEDKDILEFLSWLKNYEFNLLNIPAPDKVFFLKVDPEISKMLREDRTEKINGDIHEKNFEFMKKSYENACKVSEFENWACIDCIRDGDMKSKEDILIEILKELEKAL